MATAAVLVGSLATGYVSVSAGGSGAAEAPGGRSQPPTAATPGQLPSSSPLSTPSIQPYEEESGGEFGVLRFWTSDAQLTTVGPSDSEEQRPPLPMTTNLATQRPVIAFASERQELGTDWRVRGSAAAPLATSRPERESNGPAVERPKASAPKPTRRNTRSKVLLATSNQPLDVEQGSPGSRRSVVLVEAQSPVLSGPSDSPAHAAPTPATPSDGQPSPLKVSPAKRLPGPSESPSDLNLSLKPARTAPAATSTGESATSKPLIVPADAPRPVAGRGPTAVRLVPAQPPAQPAAQPVKRVAPQPTPAKPAARRSSPAGAVRSVDPVQLADAERMKTQPPRVAPAAASESAESTGAPSSPTAARPAARLARATRRAPAPLEPLNMLIKPSAPAIRMAQQPSPALAPAGPVPIDPAMIDSDGAIYSPPDVMPDGEYVDGQYLDGPYVEGMVDGGYELDSMGMGYGCGCGCPPTRYGYAEALWMNREAPRTRSLSNGFLFIPGDDYELGVRATVGGRIDCTDGWEASYAGLFEWDRVVQRGSGSGGLNSLFITGGGIVPADIEAFNGAAFHRQSYDSRLDSFEINRTWWGWDVFTMYMGMRYIRVDEEMLFVSIDSDADVGIFQIDTENNLIGPQIGANLIYPIGRLNVASKIKAAGFVNIDEGDTRLINDGNFLLVNGVDDWEFAALLEYGLYATYDLTPHIRARAGYEFWWIYGLALAGRQNQFVITPLTGQRLNENEDVLYHGATGGIEITF